MYGQLRLTLGRCMRREKSLPQGNGLPRQKVDSLTLLESCTPTGQVLASSLPSNRSPLALALVEGRSLTVEATLAGANASQHSRVLRERLVEVARFSDS